MSGTPAVAGTAAPAADATSVTPANPYAGPPGTATMHGDTGSSDTTPLAGPGSGSLSGKLNGLLSACPTVLIGADDYPVALCTPILGQVPTVHLLDPDTGASLTSLQLTKGSLLGGVYAYIDHEDRLVVVDGSRSLLRIGHHRDAAGSWRPTVDSSLPLGSAVPGDDAVTGLSPDWQGRVWFATGGGVVGTADDRTGTRSVALPAGERIANSISTAPQGTAALLLTSVLELRDQTDIEQVGADRPRGLEFLRHLVDTALRNAEREGIVRLYAVLSAESVTDDHPAQAYFRDRYSGLRVFVADALREACDLPERDADRAENAANAIIAVMDGLQVQWLLAPEAVDMAASTELVVTSLLTALAPGTFGPAAGNP